MTNTTDSTLKRATLQTVNLLILPTRNSDLVVITDLLTATITSIRSRTLMTLGHTEITRDLSLIRHFCVDYHTFMITYFNFFDPT
jgi:hypothetical protein